jgi:hypothetical protein
MSQKRSPVLHRPGPDATDDLHQEAKNILAEAAAEKWVVEQREAIQEARLLKAAWQAALGLRTRQTIDIGTHRRLIAFDRMVDDFYAGKDWEPVRAAQSRCDLRSRREAP